MQEIPTRLEALARLIGLSEENKRLREKNAELEEENGRLKRDLWDLKQRFAVLEARVNQIEDHFPTQCEHCEALCRAGVRAEMGEPLWHQVAELPKVAAHVTEHRLHSVLCDRCDHTTQADLPDGVPAGAFGPRLQAVIALFTGAYRISRRVAVEALGDLFGTKLSLGSVSNTEEVMSEAVSVPVEHAKTYVRTDDEGRTLIQTALHSAADIQVTPTELRVTIAPLSSPHRSAAIASLCNKLNATRTCFPGTRLRLRYAVQPAPPVSLAFPRPRDRAPAVAPPA